jgi:hypothetical protein
MNSEVPFFRKSSKAQIMELILKQSPPFLEKFEPAKPSLLNLVQQAAGLHAYEEE